MITYSAMRYYHIKELAEALGYSRYWVHELIKRKQIKTVRIASKPYVPEREFNKIVNRSKTNGKYHTFERLRLTDTSNKN